jgi:uncharacterized protein (TIGR02246 family)
VGTELIRAKGFAVKLQTMLTWGMLGCFGVVALPSAAARAGDAEKEEKVEQELLSLESQIASAVVERDAAFVQRVFGDDFVYTGVRGEIKTKKDIVAELESGQLKFSQLRFDDQRVRLYNETAVVTGRATTKGRGPQGEISGQFRYTRVYVKRDGQWQLVTFQGTPIADQSSKTPK